MNKKNFKKDDRKENTSLHGEFITSYFAWISPSIQKENAERLENITKPNNKKKIKKERKKEKKREKHN